MTPKINLALWFSFAILKLCTCEFESNFKIETVNSGVNWDPFTIEKDVNTHKSVEIISNLPMKQYWDVLKGIYRTGLIGENIQDQFPELVSTVKKSIVSSKKTKKIDALVVDATSIFLQGLAAVKNIDDYSENLFIRLRRFYESKKSILTQNHNRTISLLPRADIDMQHELLAMKSTSVDRFIEIHHNKTASKLISIQAHTKGSMENFLSLHNTLMADKDAQQAILKQLSKHKVTALLTLYAAIETAQVASERSNYEKELQNEITLLHSNVNITAELSAFRAEQEILAAKQAEQIDHRISAARNEALRQSTSQIVTTVFSQLTEWVTVTFFYDPYAFVVYGRCLALLVVAVAVVLELSSFLKLVVKRVFSGGDKIKQQQAQSVTHMRNTNSKKVDKKVHNINSTDDAYQLLDSYGIVLDNAEPDRLKDTIASQLHSLTEALRHNLPLPHFLITGPTGCGKSLLTHIISSTAQQVNANHTTLTVLNAGDLLALGNSQGGLYVRQLLAPLRGSVSGVQRKHIVVIEDVHGLIAQRVGVVRGAGGGQQLTDGGGGEIVSISNASSISSTTTTSDRSCLYALLDGIREPSPYLSVVLTSRLSVKEVDAAVLDRMDHLLHLPLPLSLQRLHFAVTLFSDTLLPLLSQSDQEVFTSFVKCNGGGVEDVHDKLMKSINKGSVLSGGDVRFNTARRGPISVNSVTTKTSRNISVVGAINTDNDDVDSPETDLPESPTVVDGSSRDANHSVSSISNIATAHSDTASLALNALISSSDLTLLETQLQTHYSDRSFETDKCLQVLLRITSGWSFREIKKALSGIQYDVMVNDRSDNALDGAAKSRLTSRIWTKELIFKARSV